MTRRGDVVIARFPYSGRSEEHTSELQSRLHLVCRLLLEKKNMASATRSSNVRTVSPPLPSPLTLGSFRRSRHYTANVSPCPLTRAHTLGAAVTPTSPSRR